MLIAHLPSGYLLAHWIEQRCPAYISHKAIMWATLSGSIFPDLDLFYFFFIDQQHQHHHIYFMHWPIIWGSLAFMTWLMGRFIKRKWIFLAQCFFFAGVLHVILDSLVGDIWWLMPWIDQSYALATVPKISEYWWISFIFHWSFLVELLICLFTIGLWLQERHQK